MVAGSLQEPCYLGQCNKSLSHLCTVDGCPQSFCKQLCRDLFMGCWASAVWAGAVQGSPQPAGQVIVLTEIPRAGVLNSPPPLSALPRTDTVAETRSSSRDFFPTKGYVAVHLRSFREPDRIWRMLNVECHAGYQVPWAVYLSHL